VNGAATVVEAKLGVSTSTAQVLTWLVVLASIYLLLQVFQSVAKPLLEGKRARGQLTLVLGQCGAGKTALFFRLRELAEVQTVSSLKPLRDTMQIKESADGEAIGSIEVMDYPGHPRLRGKLVEHLKEARCIIYVVDSENKAQLKDVAEHLYELMTLPIVNELHIPIMLALNKIDLPGARTEKFIVDELDREIEIMRASRGVALEGQDSADSYLGVDGEKFKILEHAPCPFTTGRISNKTQHLGPVYDFLRQQFA